MRKTIIIAIGVLFFLLIVLIIISRVKTSQQSNQIGPTPTAFLLDNQSPEINNQQNQRIINNAMPKTPYEDNNFRFDYSTSLNQLVVQEKTPQAKEKFSEWAVQNGLSELAGNPELVVFQNQTTGNNQSSITNNKSSSLAGGQSPDFNPLIEFINIFLNFGQTTGTTQLTPFPSPSSNPKPTNQLPSPNPSSKYYYAQCDSEYASLPLPDGCTMCQAGCGAATVAMIASSYLGNNYNPEKIIDTYKERGYLLSCAGSRYSDALSLLQSLGLKTTDYLVFNYEPADQIVGDLKNYLASGWTFFTLANFREDGGGHFFWITEIDSQGNIWAYDPYYGRFQAPPLNENNRYPFPKYRLAFGVKK
ncbi:MAG: hypothetical protein V1803_02680 [Candidatus Roizmanbacteria bacterium]